MLEVLTPSQTKELVSQSFAQISLGVETVPTSEALGRELAEDVISTEYLPPFDRSTVDGYALSACDSFGSSESIPALFTCLGSIPMGGTADKACGPGECWEIATGGMLPDGADAVAMVEYSEAYGGNSIGIVKAVSPGENLLFKGDEVVPGGLVVQAGTTIAPHHRGALDGLGVSSVVVYKRPVVGIISTGDELVKADAKPGPAQMRDINSGLLESCLRNAGALPRRFGIVPDEPESLSKILAQACTSCNMVLLSGGSSVGQRDVAFDVLAEQGEILLHGIAMKPGKPTIVARVGDIPIFGLPGHPVAAYFVYLLFVRPLLGDLQKIPFIPYTCEAVLTQALSANHGRAEYIPVACRRNSQGVLEAQPILIKSGLIALLSRADGFIEIPRDCEGLPQGAKLSVQLFERKEF